MLSFTIFSKTIRTPSASGIEKNPVIIFTIDHLKDTFFESENISGQ